MEAVCRSDCSNGWHRVILAMADADLDKTGDILVTACTDTSWTAVVGLEHPSEMGSGSACTERTGTSRSCPSRVSATGNRTPRGPSLTAATDDRLGVAVHVDLTGRRVGTLALGAKGVAAERMAAAHQARVQTPAARPGRPAADARPCAEGLRLSTSTPYSTGALAAERPNQGWVWRAAGRDDEGDGSRGIDYTSGPDQIEDAFRRQGDRDGGCSVAAMDRARADAWSRVGDGRGQRPWIDSSRRLAAAVGGKRRLRRELTPSTDPTGAIDSRMEGGRSCPRVVRS